MSKLELQRAAWEASGVSYDESLLAQQLEPSIYERIGKEDGFHRLSLDFYNRVFADKDATWFLNIFSSSTKQEAVENQYRFFVQTFGGPDLYRQKKGKYTRLAGRHANYNIGARAAERWVEHMTRAIQTHEALQGDVQARDALIKYFSYTAHYIVAASQYMRSDQVLYDTVLWNEIMYTEGRTAVSFLAYESTLQTCLLAYTTIDFVQYLTLV